MLSLPPRLMPKTTLSPTKFYRKPGYFQICIAHLHKLLLNLFLENVQLIVVFLIRDYVNLFKGEDASFEILIRNETFFREKFTQFLFSPKGASYQVSF